MTTVSEQAITVLRLTRDGDDLAPVDLALVQHVVNNSGRLTEAVAEWWAELVRRVEAGAYRAPWLEGVEHLTRDHAGHVRWKGQEVEHWDSSMLGTPKAAEQAAELARRCMILERRGAPIDTTAVIWRWTRLSEIRRAVRALVAYWRTEGDTAPAAELTRDAFLHLRSEAEKVGASLAVQRMVRNFAPKAA